MICPITDRPCKTNGCGENCYKRDTLGYRSTAQNDSQQNVSRSLLRGKHILDCCCGSRMFWFNKSNPAVLFADIRLLETDLCDGRKLEVKPDVIADFRKMPFEDNTFKMVVFDPPHLNKLGENTWMAKKYGVLLPSWEQDIKEGFEEAMRVLQPFGTLIFKWNEAQITTSKVLQVIGVEPLFGHPSGKHGRTKWMAFMKGISGSTGRYSK